MTTRWRNSALLPCQMLLPPPLPFLRNRPRSQPPRPTRSTSVNFALVRSVGVNIEADMRGRVSLIVLFSWWRGRWVPWWGTGFCATLVLISSFITTDTKERPFKCMKCRSTFVRRDLLLRHDRTVHAKDGGVPLVSEVKRRSTAKASSKATAKPAMEMDTATLEQIEASSEGMVDIETAAMLMTDLRHKATAQMTSQEDHPDDNVPPYSPDHTTMFDASNPFMSSAVPLPQMPWDNFMSNSVNEPKTSSVSSSSVSGSQDTQLSQLSFNSASTLHPNSTSAQLPPMMERFPSNNETLAPSLQNLNGTMPISGPATPNGLSPFPFMTGPVSPVDYRRSPGPSQPITSPKIPQLHSEEDYVMTQENVRKYDTDGSTYPNFQMQTRADINACLESYFKLFHHHLPFLHPESFDPSRVSPPLVYAVLSIGALYNFNQEKAYMFHIGSKVLTNSFLQGSEDFSSRKCPLWTMQSTLLNMIFASWSGDPKGLEWTCSIKSLVSNVSSRPAIVGNGTNESADGSREPVRAKSSNRGT